MEKFSDIPSEKVWPPQPLRPETILPPQRQGMKAQVIVALLGAGAFLGFILIFCGLSPLIKIYSGWSALVVFLYFLLAGILGLNAWREKREIVQVFLWLACGIVTIWAFLQTILQMGME